MDIHMGKTMVAYRKIHTCWFVFTSLQIYGTLSQLFRPTAWISKMRMTMVAYRKIHEALVHYHKHTYLWYDITTTLTDCMDIHCPRAGPGPVGPRVGPARPQ